MRKIIITVLMGLCAILMLTAVACNTVNKDSVTLTEFTVSDSTAYIEIGESYRVPSVSAKDSNGTNIVAVISVTDEANKTVVLDSANNFTPASIGNYTIKYTVTYGNDKTESKTYILEVYDLNGPSFVCGLSQNSITMTGESFDTKTITATDNSGEQITPSITVLFNGEEIDTADGVVTFEQLGVYTINVYAEDSSENVTDTDYNVYTSMDFENGYYVENQWYATDISDNAAYKGSYSYEFGAYDSNLCWFDDSSMLGNVDIIGDYTNLSFWVYFDIDSAGFNGTALINKEYYKMEVYKVNGEALAKNWQDKYEFTKNTWYRIIVDLADPLADGLDTITNLNDFKIYISIWDLTAGNNASKATKIYIDEIKLFDPENDDPNEYTIEEPEEINYTKGEVTSISYGDMLIAIDASAEGWAETALADYTIMHGLVNGTMSEFETATWSSMGTAGQNAYLEGWRLFSGYNDGVVYCVEAKDTMFVEIALSESMAGWIDTNDSSIKIYVKDANGSISTVFTSTNSSAAAFTTDAVLLKEGETLYYEYVFVWQDMRQIQNPPYLKLYTAVELVE